MEKGAPSSSPLPLFIDTNLDTHLAILASPDDTVADLKGKIRTEHALCFPKFGEVAIQALKVKRRASFYHLSDSMIVKFAFNGFKGYCFLHLDLEPMTPIMKSQTETTRVIMGENNGQPEKQNVLQANRNASLLLVAGEDRNQKFFANGMSAEEGLVQISAPHVHESETLRDTTFQKPLVQGDSLLPNVSSPQKQSLHVSSNELDKRLNPGVPETELVTESGAVVGFDHQKISRQVADHGIEADTDVPVVDSKKENTMTSIMKSQTETTGVIVAENNGQPEKQNVLQANRNASLLLVAGEDRNQKFFANGMSAEEGLVQISAPHVHESETLRDTTFQKPLVQGDSSLPNVSSPQKQSLHVSSNELDKRLNPGVPETELVTESGAVVGSDHQKISRQVADHGVEADTDVPVVDSKKENTRKRSNTLKNDQLPDGKSKHHYVEKKKRKTEKEKEKEKDRPFNEGVEDHNSGHNLESGLCSKGLSQLEKVFPENSQEKHETSLMPSEGFPSKPSDVEFSLQQIPIDDKQKKKKKKRLSTNDEPPQDEAVDNSLSKFDAILGKQAAVENHVERLVKDLNDLGKESDAADIVEESAQKELVGGSTGVGNVDPLFTNLKLSNYSTERLSKSTETSTEFPTQEVSNVDSDGLLLMKALAHGKESSATDICKEAEHPSNLAEVVPEVPAISQRSRKRSKNVKNVSSKHDVVDSSVKAADKENIDETSGNSNDKLSKAFGVALNDADINNKIAHESGIPSEFTLNSSQHSRKGKSKKSELPNGQSNTHESVNSTIYQVPEENQNKASCTSKEPPGKKLNGVAVPEDVVAAGNSAVVESTFPSNPSDKKRKHRQIKSEKIEPHHEESNLQSSTYETLNTSRDRVIEEFSKETSIRDLEDPGNESKQAAVLGEAVGNSTTVPTNPNEKKSKRSRKKSEKIELPSGESIRAKSVHSLADKVTEGNKRESLEDNQNVTSVIHLEHACKGSEEAVLTNPSTVDLILPSSPSDKKSKRNKKSGKTELPRKESSKDEAIHPLVKVVTKENPGETFDGITTGIGKNSKSATTLREAAGVENTTEFDSVITSSANGRNSCHKGKMNDGPPAIGHLSSSYDLDRSLASDPTQENLEKMSGTTGKCSGREFNARVSSDETGQNMDHMDPCNLDSTGLNYSSDKNETGHLSAEKATEEIITGLQNAHEELDMENVQDTIHKGSTVFIEAKDHGDLSKSDGGKLDFFKFFNPEANQLKPSPELPPLETETKKTSKEKTKRKKKLNPSPQDSTANLLKPSVSDKQSTIPKKPRDSDSGKHSLSDPAVQIAKEELLSSKKHKKNDANRTHKSDVNVPDRSYAVGSPRRSNNVVKPGKKRQNYESNTHFQASLSSVDDGSKHPNGKNSMRTGVKLQSLTHNEGEDMDDLVASSDSTEEDTPVVQKRFRVAVRKVPKNRSAKVPHMFNKEKTTLAPSATIFNDASSGSSDDEFEISNRKAPGKSSSDNSSTYADSDEGIEETQTSYKNSIGAEAMDNRKVEQKNNSARSSLTISPNVKRKGKPLSMILKSTSSYKRARLSASQSELENSESQQIDVVPETQPEIGLL